MRRFPKKRPTLRELQMHFRMYEPTGGAPRPPAYMDETPRAESKQPRKAEETAFCHMLLKTCRDYYRTGLAKIWLARNNNILARSMDGQRTITAGLGKGTSDCIGYTSKLVTQDMVGKRLAVFTAIETKSSTGRVEPHQQAFVDRVNADGGYGLVVRDGEDIHAIVKSLVSSDPIF